MTQLARSAAAVRFTALLFLPVLLASRPSRAADLQVSVTGTCPAAAPNTFYAGSKVTLRANLSSALPATQPSYPPCQVLTWTANDVRGKPPITLTWRTDTGISLTGNPVQLNTAQLPAGVHTVTLTARNNYGSASLSSSFSVEALAFTAPASISYLAGYQVALVAATTGATEWQWDWGDGTATPWTGGCSGLAPAKTYAGPGPYTVTLRARNCRDPQIETRFTVAPVLDLPPRVLQFAARNCPAGFCIFPPGVPILFDQAFEGEPTAYRYDWNGDGVLEETTSAPVTSHAFTPGFYQPVLQVQRGTLTFTYRHLLPIEIESDPGISKPLPPASFTATRVGVAEPGTSGTSASTPGQPLVAYRFTWTEPVGNETGFNLYVSMNGARFKLLTSEARGSRSSETLFLAKGAAYNLHLTAFNLAGESAPTQLYLDLP